MAVPVKSKPTFIHPSKDFWRAYATYVIFWNLRISNPVLNPINKISLLWDLDPHLYSLINLRKNFVKNIFESEILNISL